MKLDDHLKEQSYPVRLAVVIGTGPSLRCVNVDEIVLGLDAMRIGLNQAWRQVKNLDYSVTIHPELVWDWEREKSDCSFQWVVTSTKKKCSSREGKTIFYPHDHPEHIVFDPDTRGLSQQGSNKLYQSNGIHNSGMDLARRLGARTILMLGCDATDLGGDHHCQDEHVRFMGWSADDTYAEYREKARHTRTMLRKEGIQVLTLSPFVGVGHAEEDYAHLCKELGLEKLPEPVDVSPYNRGPKR